MLEGSLLNSFCVFCDDGPPLSLISSSVNCGSLIFSCSHLLISCYESSFLLCAFFPEYAKGDQLPSCTHSLNEWIPWSWEAIQGGHNNLFFFFDCFKLFLELSNPCEVGLHGLSVHCLHILQLIPQCQFFIDVISFTQLHQSIEQFLLCLQGWHMRDDMILNEISKWFFYL